MTIAVSLWAAGEAPCKIPEVMAATRADSLTPRGRTVAGTRASCRGRPLRERSQHVRAHRS